MITKARRIKILNSKMDDTSIVKTLQSTRFTKYFSAIKVFSLTRDNTSDDEDARRASLSRIRGWKDPSSGAVGPYKIGAGTTRLLPSAEFVEDAEAPTCEDCGTEFGRITRKHHCRSCGHVFCGPCSRERYPLIDPQASKRHQKDSCVRVCNECYSTLTSDVCDRGDDFDASSDDDRSYSHNRSHSWSRGRSQDRSTRSRRGDDDDSSDEDSSRSRSRSRSRGRSRSRSGSDDDDDDDDDSSDEDSDDSDDRGRSRSKSRSKSKSRSRSHSR